MILLLLLVVVVVVVVVVTFMQGMYMPETNYGLGYIVLQLFCCYSLWTC